MVPRESLPSLTKPSSSKPHAQSLTSIISFAREDDGSPRQDILQKFCPNDLSAFRACMSANNNDENKCLETKGILDKCAAAAFRTVNLAGVGNWVYWRLSALASKSYLRCRADSTPARMIWKGTIEVTQLIWSRYECAPTCHGNGAFLLFDLTRPL